jgi:hypothetical protein
VETTNLSKDPYHIRVRSGSARFLGCGVLHFIKWIIEPRWKLLEQVTFLQNSAVQIYIIYMNLIIHGMVPLLLLVALNVCIYRQLR